MNTPAQIKRATGLAQNAVESLDAETAQALMDLYQAQAAEIRARIAAHAGVDGTISLQELRSLLDQVEGILRRLGDERNALLTEALGKAADYGARPVLGAVLETGAVVSTPASMAVAQEALRFVQTFIAQDGLQLSDRIWRIDRGVRDKIVNALESAIIQGHGAAQAAREFLARGEAVPADVASKLGVGNATALSKAAQQAMTGDDDGPMFNAMRLFRTEINRAHGEATMMGGEDMPFFGGWKFLLSPAHPKPDICDLLSSQNLYGLGPGVYPNRAALPWPAHPNTLSFVVMVFKDKITAEDRAGKETPMEALARLTQAQREGVLGVGKAEIYDQGKLRQGMIRSPLGAVKARLDKTGNDATMTAMSPSYIEATKPGGRHHGWYLRLTLQSDGEIEKAVRSFERQIARHEGWIAAPRSKAPDFGEFHPQRQVALVAGWQQDIARHRESIDILRDILKERQNGQA